MRKAASAIQTRGSILVMSYFIIVVLLGLAIPQSMRSLHYLKLENQHVDVERAFHVAEAARAHLLKTIFSTPPDVNAYQVNNPFFGEQGDGEQGDTATTHILGTNPTFAGIPSCTDPAWNLWDCWPTTEKYTVGATKYSVLFRAADEGPPPEPPFGGPVLKRVQMVVYRGSDFYDYPIPTGAQWVQTHEVMVRVEFRGLGSTMKSGTRLQVTLDNGIEQTLIKGQYIVGYGDVTPTGAQWDEYMPIAVSGNQSIWGKVYVKHSPGSDLCCSANDNPKDEIALATGSTPEGARIRELPSDPNYLWNMALTGPELATLNVVAPLVATAQSGAVLGMPDKRPENLSASESAFIYTKVKPEMPETTPSCSVDITSPISGGARTITFCQAGDFTGVCNQADTAAGEHQVHHIGQLASDGQTVEYCVNSVNAATSTEIRFQGDNVQVYLKGYQLFGAVPIAFRSAGNTNIYAFKQSESALIPKTGLLITQTIAGYNSFLNALKNDPNYLGRMSVNVLESNKHKLQGGSWVPDPNTYAIDQQPAMVPKVAMTGGFYVGTVNAPRSAVELAFNFMETRQGNGLLIGRRVEWGGGTLLLTPEPGSLRYTPQYVNLLAWRKCYAENCSR